MNWKLVNSSGVFQVEAGAFAPAFIISAIRDGFQLEIDLKRLYPDTEISRVCYTVVGGSMLKGNLRLSVIEIDSRGSVVTMKEITHPNKMCESLERVIKRSIKRLIEHRSPQSA